MFQYKVTQKVSIEIRLTATMYSLSVEVGQVGNFAGYRIRVSDSTTRPDEGNCLIRLFMRPKLVCLYLFDIYPSVSCAAGYCELTSIVNIMIIFQN